MLYFKEAEIHVYGVLILQYIQKLSGTLGKAFPIVLPAGQQHLYRFNAGPFTGTDCSLMLLSWASDAGRETLLICEIGQYIKSVLVFKLQ